MASDLETLLGAVAVDRPGWETAPIVLFREGGRSLTHDVDHGNFELWQRIEDTCGIRRGTAGNTEVSAPTRKWLFLLDRPWDLLDVVPDHWRDPQPTKLERGITWLGGLPRNLWLGTTLRAGCEVEVESLLEARVAHRFLVRLREQGDAGEIAAPLALALGGWRCRICGERGRAPRPDRCRRWKMLCSESTIVPLVDWVVDEVGDVAEAARAAGCAVGLF